MYKHIKCIYKFINTVRCNNYFIIMCWGVVIIRSCLYLVESSDHSCSNLWGTHAKINTLYLDFRSLFTKRDTYRLTNLYREVFKFHWVDAVQRITSWEQKKHCCLNWRQWSSDVDMFLLISWIIPRVLHKVAEIRPRQNQSRHYCYARVRDSWG